MRYVKVDYTVLRKEFMADSDFGSKNWKSTHWFSLKNSERFQGFLTDFLQDF